MCSGPKVKKAADPPPPPPPAPKLVSPEDAAAQKSPASVKLANVSRNKLRIDLGTPGAGVSLGIPAG